MVKVDKNIPARAVCASILSRWLETGDFPDRMLPRQHTAAALIQEIVFGSLRWFGALQWRILQLVPREPDPAAMGFLLTGMYQLFYLDNIPAHAAVHETVEAAKASLDPARCRFLNAVLRNALRQQNKLEANLCKAPLAVRWSHPASLIQRWQTSLGPEQTEALCRWNNERPTISLRMYQNLAQPVPEKLKLFPVHPNAPDQYRIVPTGTSVEQIPGFKEGAFYIQDPATELAVDLLDPQPGMQLLDACAAPGGKSFACADRMHNQGQIIALDRHADRLERMQANVARTQFSIIDLRRADATRSDELPRQAFDRILLDVPCSNTGVLQRRPDARWRITPERIQAMTDVQHRILTATAPLLAENGVLVYSTCSLEPEENVACVHAWIQQNPAFYVSSTRTSIPPASGMDGAFAARIERKTTS